MRNRYAEAQDQIVRNVLGAFKAYENPGTSDLDDEQPVRLEIHTTLGTLRALRSGPPLPRVNAPAIAKKFRRP